MHPYFSHELSELRRRDDAEIARRRALSGASNRHGSFGQQLFMRRPAPINDPAPAAFRFPALDRPLPN